jgi:rhodanese-related sulfurtransferase
MNWSRFAALAGAALIGTVILGTTPVAANETPPTLPGAKTVSADEVKPLLGKALILDVRRKAAFQEGHLQGAKSITHAHNKDAKSFDLSVFGGDKSVTIVIHGHGSDGWSAVDAVNTAVKAGYTNVLWLRGGYKEWTDKGLPVAN